MKQTCYPNLNFSNTLMLQVDSIAASIGMLHLLLRFKHAMKKHRVHLRAEQMLNL